MTYLTGERAGQKKTSMLANVFRNSLGASHQASPWQSVTKMERVKPISRPALNTHPAVEDRNVLDPTSEVPVRRHRSSGWGRYFSESLPEGQQSTSTKSEPHILGGSLGAARNESDERRSQDSDLHSLAEIPPLSAHLQDYPGHPGIARVNSGYAQERDSSTFGVAITTPMSGQIAHISEAEDESNPFDDPGSARRDLDETRASVGGSSVWTNDTRHQSQNTGLVPPSYGSGAVERRPSTQQSPVSWLDLGRPR